MTKSRWRRKQFWRPFSFRPALSYNSLVTESSPKTVGLGGDGDEIVAINDVERAFNVKLDYADAPSWRTAGDLFASLERVLPDNERGKGDAWDRFVVALSGQTGVDPSGIKPGSPLLSESQFWAKLADTSAIVWIIAFLGVIAAVTVAALTSMG